MHMLMMCFQVAFPIADGFSMLRHDRLDLDRDLHGRGRCVRYPGKSLGWVEVQLRDTDHQVDIPIGACRPDGEVDIVHQLPRKAFC